MANQYDDGLTPEERYCEKVNKNGPEAKCIETGEDLGKCWEWTAFKLKSGHGRFWFNGKLVQAHRFAWLQEHGEMPAKGLVIHHRCDNPGCQNVAHMELMTQSEHATLHILINPTPPTPKSTHCRGCEVELTGENQYAGSGGACKKCHSAECVENKKKRKAKKLGRAA